MRKLLSSEYGIIHVDFVKPSITVTVYGLFGCDVSML